MCCTSSEGQHQRAITIKYAMHAPDITVADACILLPAVCARLVNPSVRPGSPRPEYSPSFYPQGFYDFTSASIDPLAASIII